MSDFWEHNNSDNPTVVVIIALQLCSAISCVVGCCWWGKAGKCCIVQTRPGNEDAVAVQCSSADNEAVISRLLGELGCKWAGPGCIISLSIQKLAEKAKSPPCQPRLSQGPLCPLWQPQAVREQIRHSLPAPGCHRVIKVHLGSPRLSKWAKPPF